MRRCVTGWWKAINLIFAVDDLLEVAEDCTKLSIYKDSGVEAAARSLVEEFKDILQISCAGDMWLDCMAKDVNKGHAVKVIQDSLGIKPEETMALVIS